MSGSNKVLQDILQTITEDAPVRRVLCGIRWTAVVSKRCGLASSMAWESCTHQDKPVNEAGALHEKSVRQLARYSLSESISEASIGLAAINSSIDIQMSKCIELNAADILEEKGKNKNISVIGFFPFVDRLSSVAKNVWVIERRRALGCYPEEEADKFLPQSEIVAISATTLINHTLEKILSLSPPASLKMVIGASTPLSPILFEYGIDILCGSLVIDTNGVLNLIGEGASFRQMKQAGIKLVTMAKDNGLLSSGKRNQLEGKYKVASQ
jgi:uncharacterized protein (DUF4213/DUF364 family)